MHLTDDDIREFREMWREEFQEDISPAAARECARLLIEFYLGLFEPPEGDEKPDERRQEDLRPPP